MVRHRIGMLALILVLSLITACGPSHPDAPLPRQAPYARLFLIDGTTSSVRAYRGKTTVVLFWASWCSYSKNEILEYNKIARRLAGRDDIVFVAASIDTNEASAEVDKIIKDKNLDATVHAFSGNEVADEAYYLMKGGDLPHYMVIDKQGKIVLSDHSVDDVKEYLQSTGYL